ncbi:hypothetical protein C8R31_103293 [Nitrosospira sp. Nsp2]|nr:hypothetical protein C8R31_103293 [Nitrosospira sp. Nsp2]
MADRFAKNRQSTLPNAPRRGLLQRYFKIRSAPLARDVQSDRQTSLSLGLGAFIEPGEARSA